VGHSGILIIIVRRVHKKKFGGGGVGGGIFESIGHTQKENKKLFEKKTIFQDSKSRL